jgi:hypothetical protein
MSGTPVLRTNEERQAAIDKFRAEGKPAVWIHGWWRYQMRHQDEEGQDAVATRSSPK